VAKKLLGILPLVLVIAVFAGLGYWLSRPKSTVGPASVADLSVVHPGVKAAGVEARGLVRLHSGAKAETDPTGRARIRLDDGSVAVLDRSSRASVGAGEITLEAGRLFVIGAEGAKTEVKLGEATVHVSHSNVGFEMLGGASKAYAANEEVSVVAGGTEHKLAAGDSATIQGTNVEVTPEKAFDDWTGGLAAPWGASGAPRRSVGELWGCDISAPVGDAGSPLTVRAHEVDAKLSAEMATTRVTSTYFNGGSQTVRGDFRMALPPTAIVSRFAWGPTPDSLEEGSIALASRQESTFTPSRALLEWAGEGWVRGHLPSIASGAAISVVVEYVQWLDVKHDGSGQLVAEYRYPLAAPGEAPLIGEFSARIDASKAHARSISAGSGATVNGSVISLRRPDFRPTADLVVDVTLPRWESGARMYVATPEDGDDFSTVLVRADLPDAGPDAGATLALVVDTSGSAESAELDVSRAFVRAVLDMLGERDRVVVLAADQNVRPVGPKDIGPLDAARKAAIVEALAQLSPGGATDLGRALEAGADALPPDSSSGLVVYVGDGWPTVGDADVTSIEARLARRATGKPRLGAVGVGPLANSAALRALTRGSGPLIEITDSADAASAATDLVADALRPAYSDVSLDLGPEVEQVYPRTKRSAIAGTTIEAVGRLRGPSPSAVTLRWRDKGKLQEVRHLVSLRKAELPEDIRRRWAAARVEEVVLSGRGRETATDVALKAGLLTAWTGLAAGGKVYVPTLLEARQLDVSIGDVTPPFAADVEAPPFGALASVPHPGAVSGEGSDKDLEADVREAVARTIDSALPSVRACRDSRAALRPDLSGSLQVSLGVDGDGKAFDVKVRGTTADADDAALDRCVEVALEGLHYPESGLTVKIVVEREIALPLPKPSLRGAKCSSLSQLPLPLRRGVWRARLSESGPADVYLAAKRSCELPSWADRRALLELIMLVKPAGLDRVAVARDLEAASDADAAAFLRREAVRRAQNASELAAVKRALVGDEKYPLAVFRKRYKAANDDAGRLAVVRKFLTIAPHDGYLRSRLAALLEARGMKDPLREEARLVRQDPFAPAELLANVASALRRIGDEDDARRSFGELAERAPADPWARAFLGDRLRDEGWFDDATRTYAALSELAPEDPAAVLRLALAHAGAGRLDIARRLLTRVVETGGRLGDPSAAQLAAHVAAALLAEARSGSGLAKEQTDALTFAALEIPRAESRIVVLVRSPAARDSVEAKLVRKTAGNKEEIAPEISAETMGLTALAFERGSADVELTMSRSEELEPARPTRVRVQALVPSGSLSAPPKLVETDVELPPSGKPVTLAWSEGGWTPKK
jgi:tetratricopeptide (TPR) repeat protein